MPDPKFICPPRRRRPIDSAAPQLSGDPTIRRRSNGLHSEVPDWLFQVPAGTTPKAMEHLCFESSPDSVFSAISGHLDPGFPQFSTFLSTFGQTETVRPRSAAGPSDSLRARLRRLRRAAGRPETGRHRREGSWRPESLAGDCPNERPHPRAAYPVRPVPRTSGTVTAGSTEQCHDLFVSSSMAGWLAAAVTPGAVSLPGSMGASNWRRSSLSRLHSSCQLLALPVPPFRRSLQHW